MTPTVAKEPLGGRGKKLCLKQITDAFAARNKTITDTTQTLLQLTDSLTQHMTTLEQASPSNFAHAILRRLDALEGDRTPQPKKPKISQHPDAQIATATPLPSDND